MLFDTIFLSMDRRLTEDEHNAWCSGDALGRLRLEEKEGGDA